MTITRSILETILVRRCGKWLIAAGLDGTTVNGTNPDLNDPIGYAARKLGLTVANPTSVSDGDLAALNLDELDKLLDVAEYRALQTVLENFEAVTLEVGGRHEHYSEFADRLQKLIALKALRLEKDYGLGQGTLDIGVIQLDFAQHSDSASTTLLPN